MGVLKTLAPALLVLFTSMPVASFTAASDRLEYLFAGCVGRFSAEMEHAWLMNRPDADHLEDKRRTFISLMEASMPPEVARHVLEFRIDHKMAHASLLTTATFSSDERHAQRAKDTARAYLMRCERMLLDS